MRGGRSATKCDMSRGLVLALALVALLMTGCSPSSNSHGRTVCPGAVVDATGQIPADSVDVLVRLQETYENDPGFLAVVWDGRRPVIVVDRAQVQVWASRLAGEGTAVAPSCIDPTLLALVYEALPRINVPGESGAGYDALDDAIFVTGVDTDVLLTALDAVRPGVRVAALAAIADGTLRIDPAQGPGGRQ
jgi:hypothetical protein